MSPGTHLPFLILNVRLDTIGLDFGSSTTDSQQASYTAKRYLQNLDHTYRDAIVYFSSPVLAYYTLIARSQGILHSSPSHTETLTHSNGTATDVTGQIFDWRIGLWIGGNEIFSQETTPEPDHEWEVGALKESYMSRRSIELAVCFVS